MPAIEVIGALLGVALLEQQATLAELAERGLARERAQVLVLEPVERREDAQNFGSTG